MGRRDFSGPQLTLKAARSLDYKHQEPLDCQGFFLLVVLKSCEGRPVFLVDGGPWYESAFKSLGLDFVHVTFGPRNSVERWFRTVKERTKRFWNNFRSNDWRRVQKFVFLFAFWYNFVRRHSRFNAPPGDVTEWFQEVMPKLS